MCLFSVAYLRVASSQCASLDPTERQDVDLHLGIFYGVIAATQAEYLHMVLKELEVRYATKRQKDYKLADGEGLYLLVRPNGSKL